MGRTSLSDPALTPQQRGARPIHRLLPVVSVIIAAVLLIGSAPVDAATRKVALGISMFQGPDLSAVTSTFERFQRETGATPRLWSLWSQWGVAATREFPTAKANAVRALGATPFIFWEPWTGDTKSCEYARHKRIANGKYDKYIKRFARAAKAYGGTVLLRYTHEINAKYFPWTTNKCGNTVTDFKKSWRRVYNLFRKVGAKKVKFVWTVAKERCPGCNPWADHYPGDRYVQYVGFSSFNWGEQKGNWQPMLHGVSQAMRTMREVTRKPVIIAELATAPCCDPDNGSMGKPNWIREGYPAVYKQWPQIKAIIYLNVDLRAIRHPDWSLDRPDPETHQAYAEIASQLRFKGRIR